MGALALTTTLAAGAGCNGDTKGLAEVYDTGTRPDRAVRGDGGALGHP